MQPQLCAGLPTRALQALLLSWREGCRLGCRRRAGCIKRTGERALATRARVPHRDFELAVRGSHRRIKVVGTRHGLAVERQNHVARYQACLLGSAARDHTCDHLTLRGAVFASVRPDAKLRPIVDWKAIALVVRRRIIATGIIRRIAGDIASWCIVIGRNARRVVDKRVAAAVAPTVPAAIN